MNLTKIISVAALLVAATFSAHALNFTVDGMKYTTLTDNTVAVMGEEQHKGLQYPQSANITVPEMVTNEGVTYTVTEVGKDAFGELDDEFKTHYLETVVLPNTITAIGENAFGWCLKLYSVTLWEGLKEIDMNAFQKAGYKVGLDLTLPTTCKKLEDWAFAGSGVKSLDISANASLGERCLWMCKNLTHLTLGANVKLGSLCLMQMDALETLAIPEGVTALGQQGVYFNTSLKCVILPSTLKSMGKWALARNPLQLVISHAQVPPTCGTAVFDGFEQDKAVLIVPAVSVESYKEADQWKAFGTIIADTATLASAAITGVAQEVMPSRESSFSIPFNVFNSGTQPLTALTYAYTLNDGEEKTFSITLTDTIQPGNIGVADLDFNPIDAAGTYDVAIRITGVNGEANLKADEKYNFKLTVVMSKQVPEDAFEYAYYQPGITENMGYARNTVFNVAMKLRDPALAGCKVVGMKVSDLIPSNAVKNYRGWVSKTLFSQHLQDIGGMRTGNEMTIVFDEPVEVPSDGLIVGYEGESVNENGYRCVPYTSDGQAGNLYVQYLDQGKEWYDYCEYGSATISVYLTGSIQENGLKVLTYRGSDLIVTNEPYKIDFTVEQCSPQSISTFDYTYTVNGKSVEGTAQVDIPAVVGRHATLSLDCAPVTIPGVYPFELTINKVNSKDNTSTQNKGNVSLRALTFMPVKRPLLEEGTGTWCGFCTRGWLGMKLMNEKYPNFIGVAWHNDDPMTVSTSWPFNMSGFPGALIDRVHSLDPFFGYDSKTNFGIYEDYAQIAREITEGEISLNTQWGGDRKTLEVDAQVKFATSGKGYKIGYTLVQDSLCYEDAEGWAQKNYYKTGGEGYLSMLIELPDYPVYDDVAIEVSKSHGVNGSLPDAVVADEVYTHHTSFATESILGLNAYANDEGEDAPYELLVNKDKLYVVAYIISPDGHIVNAVKQKASSEESGITGMTDTNDGNVVYYDLMGRHITNPGHGIYIKKTGNRATKVLM